MNFYNKSPERFLTSLFFLSFLLLGFCIFRDYGLSTDEPLQRIIGLKSLDFLAHKFQISWLLNGAQPLSNPESIFSGFADRDYGVIFELPAELLVRIFSIQGPEIYYARHLFTFLVFFTSCIFFYKTIIIRYADFRIALLGTAILVLSPRIFGDSFFNDKDLVFLSLFVIATYTLFSLIVRLNTRSALWHALACAFAINCRMMGIILPVVTVAVLVFLLVFKKISLKNCVRIFGVYALSITCLVVLFWPWLWANPYEHFLTALKNMAHFRTVPNLHFMGHVIPANNLPWFYVPVWIFITTPIGYLIFFIVGLIATIAELLRNGFFPKNKFYTLLDIINLGLAISPVLMVILLHSVLYNGWRHLYFIYPSVVMVCLFGIHYLWRLARNHSILQMAFKGGILILLLINALWMIKWHPYQYLYFNSLAGNWAKKYDVDYWAVAYIRPLRKIVDQDKFKNYAIYNNLRYGSKGEWIFEYPNQVHWQLPYSWQNFLLKERIPIINRSETCSDYVFLPEIGGRTQEYQNKSEFELFDEVRVGDHIIYSIFKRRVPLEGGLYSPYVGDTVSFADPNARCFLFEGWHDGHESWGVWSVANRAKLWLRPAPNSRKVEIDFRALVGSAHPVQKIIIQVANEDPKVFQFASFESNKIILDIPPEAKKAEFIKIDIDLPNSVSPMELGLSQDGRKLGVGIKSIKYLP